MLRHPPSSENTVHAQENEPSGGKPETARNFSYVRLLREERKITQRELAKRLGVSRTHLQRLEAKASEELSVMEIQRLARTFAIKTKDLLERIFLFSEEGRVLSRCSIEKPVFVTKYEDGIEFGSFLRQSEACYIGKLKLSPKKSLSRQDHPKGALLFWFILEGSLLLTLGTKEHLFKTGECFSLDGGMPYEMFNPHQIKDVLILSFAAQESEQSPVFSEACFSCKKRGSRVPI